MNDSTTTTTTSEWTEYKPKFRGDRPQGVSLETHDIEMRSSTGLWRAFTTSNPMWSHVLTYRYRRKALPDNALPDEVSICPENGKPCICDCRVSRGGEHGWSPCPGPYGPHGNEPAPIGHNGGPPLDDEACGGLMCTNPRCEDCFPSVSDEPTLPMDLPETPVSSGGSLPEDADLRNQYPMADGLLDYFPNALAEVSLLSHTATQQHHPDKGMHWDRSKSLDHRNKIVRHLVDTGKRDNKGMRHSAMVAWRALALLQEEIERDEGLPPSRASRNRPVNF